MEPKSQLVVPVRQRSEQRCKKFNWPPTDQFARLSELRASRDGLPTNHPDFILQLLQLLQLLSPLSCLLPPTRPKSELRPILRGQLLSLLHGESLVSLV
jgi:hypothetical protein